jgi:hypothetical protein
VYVLLFLFFFFASQLSSCCFGMSFGSSTANACSSTQLGIQPEELDELNVPNKLRRVLSFEFASQSEITTYRKTQALKKWQRFDGDTGSPEAQSMSCTALLVSSSSLFFLLLLLLLLLLLSLSQFLSLSLS